MHAIHQISGKQQDINSSHVLNQTNETSQDENGGAW